MTVKDAVRVANIMLHHNLGADKEIAAFLTEFPEIDWVDFFNEAEFDQGVHDLIFARLDELRDARNAYRRNYH